MTSALLKRPILLIICITALLLLPYLEAIEVTIMEARNFIAAREMLTDGNWILTTMNGIPRYEKPPLPTWLSALSAAIFGVEKVWAMRLPAVMMVMVLGVVVFTLSRKLHLNKTHSLMNGLISVTSLYVVLIIFEAPWDIYAHGFMLLAIVFLYQNVKASPKATTAYFLNWMAIVFSIAASLLSKGPVALYILLLPFLIAYTVVYRNTFHKGGIRSSMIALFLGCVLGLSWHLYVQSADAESLYHILKKETNNWMQYNVRPFYYYWDFFIQTGIWTVPAALSLVYPYLKNKVTHLKAYQLTWLWTVTAVILLSLIPSKKTRYLMPVLIPLALNTGFYVYYIVKCFRSEMVRWERVIVYFYFGLVGMAFVLGPFVGGSIGNVAIESLDIVGWMAVIGGIIFGILVIRTLYKKQIKSALLACFCGLLCTSTWGKIIVKNYNENTGYTTFKKFDTIEKLPIYSYTPAKPEVVWKSGGHIPNLLQPEALQYPQEDMFYLLQFQDDAPIDNAYFSNYSLQYIFDLDLNTAQNSSRNYKDRNVAKVFKVMKTEAFTQ